MSGTHTPAPWTATADPYEDGTPYFLIEAGDYLAEGDAMGFRFTGIMREADARLIASAPALLEALKAMCAVQSSRRHPLGLPDEGIAGAAAEAMSKARAAIAEAEANAAMEMRAASLNRMRLKLREGIDTFIELDPRSIVTLKLDWECGSTSLILQGGHKLEIDQHDANSVGTLKAWAEGMRKAEADAPLSKLRPTGEPWPGVQPR